MRRPVASALLGLLISASPLIAAPINFTLSPATAGLTWSIENLGLVPADLAGDDGDTYAILLTLETAGYEGAGEYLSAFSVDFADGSLDAISLVSAPAGYGFSISQNVGVAGASSGCGGSSAGSACVGDGNTSDSNLALAADGVYTWLFHVDTAGVFAGMTTLELAIATIHQAKFTGGATVITGTAGTLAPASNPGSENELSPTGPDDLAPIPEPTSLVLLGTGLIVAANRLRRRT